MTKKLLSLPPNLVDAFHEVTGLSEKEYFCTSDPIGARLGSGGGTTWLLEECHRNSGDAEADFAEWLSSEKEYSFTPEARAVGFRHTRLRARYSRRCPYFAGSAARS